VQYQAINDIACGTSQVREGAPASGWAYRSLLVQRSSPSRWRSSIPTSPPPSRPWARPRARATSTGGLPRRSFAAPDPKRAEATSAGTSTRAPRSGRGGSDALLRDLGGDRLRHNRLFVDFAYRNHLPHVLVHEKLDDPRSSSTCATSPRGHRAPRGDVPSRGAELVEDTDAYRSWKSAPAAVVDSPDEPGPERPADTTPEAWEAQLELLSSNGRLPPRRPGLSAHTAGREASGPESAPGTRSTARTRCGERSSACCTATRSPEGSGRTGAHRPVSVEEDAVSRLVRRLEAIGSLTWSRGRSPAASTACRAPRTTPTS